MLIRRLYASGMIEKNRFTDFRKAHIACRAICLIGEGPVWNVQRQAIYWTDILRGRIWEHSPASRRNRMIWQGPMQVGGFAFTRTGGMLICSDQGVFLLDPEQIGTLHAIPEKIFDIPLMPGERFNDITVDPAGRVFAGTLYEGHPGQSRLFRLERGRPPRQVLGGITCSNGMTFSLDQQYFYHTNSGARRIDRYQYDIHTGNISNPQPFFQGSQAQGTPDGLTLDSEDTLWIAFWGGAVVRRVSPQGAIIAEFPMPVRQPSSVMFGGPDLHDLYVTSAAQGADIPQTGRDRDGTRLGGPLFRLSLPVAGRTEWLAGW